MSDTNEPAKPSPKPAIELACDVMDGQGNLARALRVTPSTVSQWVRGKRPVPAERCPSIERLTRERGQRVPCEHIRPDVEWWVVRAAAAA